MTSNQKSILRMKIFKWGTRILLIIIAIIMLFPLIWNIYSAFKTNTEFLSNPFSLPSGLEWDNFARAIQKSDLGANIGNSLFVVLETLVILVVCAIPCSYCLVRYKFFGAKIILTVYMAAIFIQATYIMIPLFLQMNSFNLLNNRAAIGVLYATMQFPFAIFLLTGFMRSIPGSYITKETESINTALFWIAAALILLSLILTFIVYVSIVSPIRNIVSRLILK